MQIVPQYIDVEDKIAGPLTWKHIGWFFAGGAVAALAWVTLDRLTFIIVAVFIALLTAAFAFYRPNGVSMIEFVGYGINFLFRPKVYMWQQEVEKKRVQKKKEMAIATTSEKKGLTTDDVALLAKTLDSHGAARSERIKQLIKERTKQ